MLSPGERRFLALAAAAAVCIVSLAFWYAVPPSPAQASPAAVEPLRESFRVAMTTLPGLGEKKARAILEYRLAHGRFQSLDEVAQVPGVTQDMIDEWQGLAYVS
jgi:competence protein ComEA